MKIALIIIAILIGITAVLTFAFGYVMYRYAIVRTKKEKRQVNYWEDGGENKGFFLEMREEVGKRASECAAKIKADVTDTVYITSRDGLNLCGHIVEGEGDKGVAILMHGYRSGVLVDFSLSADYFRSRGFTLLLPDERAHGESEGGHICFGALERFDVVDWAKYAEERWPDKPVLVCGVSMGASAVMMGAGVGYPKNVKAIMADCGFTSGGEIGKKCLKQWFHLPPFPVYYGAKLWTKWLAHFDLDEVSSRKSLENLRGTGIKVLIVHGKADDFVPYEMSLENVKAFDYMPESARREAMEFLSVEGAGHAQSFVVDEKTYVEALDRLLAKAGM